MNINSSPRGRIAHSSGRETLPNAEADCASLSLVLRSLHFKALNGTPQSEKRLGGQTNSLGNTKAGGAPVETSIQRRAIKKLIPFVSNPVKRKPAAPRRDRCRRVPRAAASTGVHRTRFSHGARVANDICNDIGSNPKVKIHRGEEKIYTGRQRINQKIELWSFDRIVDTDMTDKR
ncbi:hypothetical protein EVAR_101270_1 [Eumeta japonica]|uniref:Uncharacterized protein n=1 Tax=Eumeta variegata TaxID=151549 RepID=A0A4C1T3Y3_EUMVA|nr:hypothetical protein EVAR_101270_1 [Eumeta japonica]